MHTEIINFWFTEIDKSKWWAKDDAFDKLISSRFLDLHNQAIQCELASWRETALGRLAEIIILDQFSRNIYRDTPKAFAYDAQALALAQEAIAGGFDMEIEQEKRSFLYMPFMHSESLFIHEKAVELFKSVGSESSLNFEYKHKAIIDQFGRYPHRNEILGRETTKEEEAFLKQPGSAF